MQLTKFSQCRKYLIECFTKFISILNKVDDVLEFAVDYSLSIDLEKLSLMM